MPLPDRRRRASAVTIFAAVLVVIPLAVWASDRFTDVPDSNVHHDDITWLADNEVTFGCNPPANDQYCPEDTVLRQQMASFMRRLAENQVVDAATAVSAQNADHAATAGDSDQLGGQGPEQYTSVVSHAGCGLNEAVTATSCGEDLGALPDQTTVEVLAAQIAAPAEGVAQVSMHAFSNATLWVTLDDQCAAYVTPFTEIFAQLFNGLIVAADPVAAGSSAGEMGAGNHTIRLCAAYEDTSVPGGGSILIGNLTAQWTAGGTVEAEPFNAPTGDPLPLGGDTLLGG